ncbi:MAG TPA: branched-chain amino acid transaminase [Cyclobacteriaceae bacterium]|jgi:branched-chain amino acid aminotransferase|nr:branched-chain amino acid transaminase [Cyclobacteriaceae bacterium]HRE67045.1 branched-chain amino acid transaminase [Cyclobacteriaceae bacterium]HRF32344.1 branched-chain amino acid transaminase [Cyclobacteriaceae bacterium]
MYYSNNTILFHDGKFVKAKDASTDLYSQTLHYGYGAFEGIRAYQTINGVKIFKAHEHFERLQRSCELVGIPFTYSTEELTQLSYQVLEKNNLKDAYIRPLVYCAPNMTLSAPTGVSVMIAAWEWGKYHGAKPLKVCVSSFQRPNPKSVKMEAKVCGHYVNSIMATNEAKQRGFDEALMLDMNGFVAEGPGANFFFEKDGVLYTPPLGNILPGITRQTVFEICREMDLPVVEKHFRPEELFEADSAFFCGTAAEVVAIESIEGQAFSKPWKHSMGAVVQEAYTCIVLDKSYSYVIV